MSIQSVSNQQPQTVQNKKNDEARTVRVMTKLGAGIGLIQSGLDTFASAENGTISKAVKKATKAGKSKFEAGLEIAKVHGKHAALVTGAFAVAGAALGKIINSINRSEEARSPKIIKQQQEQKPVSISININAPANESKKADKANKTEEKSEAKPAKEEHDLAFSESDLNLDELN